MGDTEETQDPVVNEVSDLTCGMRCRRASPLRVPTARATKKLSKKLKLFLLMTGSRTRPTTASRLIIVMERNPPSQAVK